MYMEAPYTAGGNGQLEESTRRKALLLWATGRIGQELAPETDVLISRLALTQTISTRPHDGSAEAVTGLFPTSVRAIRPPIQGDRAMAAYL
ncbi:hypothetical protein N7457_001976 [Penicillium paradoxum]|uniref:uncharacterized protein n=1 Tax=Penicillium paradoxum TaxID=176176 RepID=UPI0025495625|nr:uncharacterized protein N7457_001976 [Penicillium paradoxum]KAJ5786986.1 hypothetical protein N7457_001976 [Penicillium paradoxum]